MSQPNANRFHVSNLLEPALGEIVHVIADRDDRTNEQYKAKARDTWTLVQSIQARDAIELILAGQLIATNEMFADGMRDVLRGMEDSRKLRARSGVVAMARLALAQIAELDRRGVRPHRTEIATVMEQRTEPVAKVVSADLREALQAPHPTQAKPSSRPPGSEPIPEPVREPTPPIDEPAEEAASWVDEPYQEWLEETPAMLAAQSAPIPIVDAQKAAMHPGNADALIWTDLAADPDLPHLHVELPPAQPSTAAVGA